MALPVNISDLIHQRVVESTRIEYKGDWNPEPVIHSITAFANDFDNLGGGYIILGIEEKNGRPVFPLKGLNPDALDAIQKDILNKCNLIEPRYIPVVEPKVIDGKDILVLWVPGGDDRPYKCPEKVYTEKSREKSEKAFYIRKLANTVKANYLEERELVELALVKEKDPAKLIQPSLHHGKIHTVQQKPVQQLGVGRNRTVYRLCDQRLGNAIEGVFDGISPGEIIIQSIVSFIIVIMCRRSRSCSCPGISPQRIGPLARSYHHVLRPGHIPSDGYSVFKVLG